MSALLVWPALLMGLLGSTHCVVMCGGVVSMTCSALPLDRRRSFAAQLPYALSYNAGRIASYALGGALAGGVGASLEALGSVSRALLVLRVAAGLLMIAVGCYIAGWGAFVRKLERVGEPMWRRIAPLARALVPVRTPSQALLLGLIWGWMPCGLVYAALAASVTSGSLLGGAATMTAFGIGTLPTLLAMGSAAASLSRLARNRAMRTVAAIVVATFGVAQVGDVGVTWFAEGAGTTPACCAAHHAVATR